ncbi:GNAT family N-acetyltransferase [Aeromicrobium sp. CnD17-E]|uniref:GNAT family N-acetyltransferase n=1 Tax=Aeromicrobium sp. CnD17-E TaxID=2954487 RepID=UPI0020976C50|nr:GNAT family N-acetyltransferase [Aeromicrobium sp. CnD17-E]MCO7240096.1 GNAT family N-acetyltransferase [Aeromicrobium sp. CnD17-E]
MVNVPTSGTREGALAFIHRQQERLVRGEGYSFAVVDAARGRAVGQIGLWLREVEHGRASIGYWIAPPFRARGLAATSLVLRTDWALGLPEVHRVQLCVEPWNESSWRFAERCGYEREGLLRSWLAV